MTARKRLILIAYAPALVGTDGRALAVVQGMERAFPGLRLGWRVGEDGRAIAVPRRDEWVAAGSNDGGFPLVCNGDESYPVTVTGWGSPARLSPGGQPLFEVHAKLPLDDVSLSAASDVLEAAAEGARAYWGHATPDGAALDIASQTSPTLEGRPRPLRGLPALKLPEDISAPEIPHRLGWLNYWSAAAAGAIGFPDPTRDAGLLTRARRTESGGWVVQLTGAPLDLDDPAHLDALRRAYERFPAIGGRSDP